MSAWGQNKKSSQRANVFCSCHDSTHVSARPRGDGRGKDHHAGLKSTWPHMMLALTRAADRSVKVRIDIDGTSLPSARRSRQPTPDGSPMTLRRDCTGFKGCYCSQPCVSRGQPRTPRGASGVPVTDFSSLRKMTVRAHPEIRPAIYLSTLSILI